jgi:UDP-N-acetylglucosamine 4-epimerase
VAKIKPNYAGFRPGDVRYSQADISKAKRLLDYVPAHDVSAGLNETVQWHMKNVELLKQ